MGSLSSGFGLEAVDTTITALNAALAAMQAQMTALQAQLAVAQAFVASTPARLTTGAAITDWNAITESGWYFSYVSSTSNAPDNINFWFGTVETPSASFQAQHVSRFDVNGAMISMRRSKLGATWSAWEPYQLTIAQMDARYVAASGAVRAALSQPTIQQVRDALGLGSAAVASVGDFEPAGAASVNSTDVEERARDAVAAALSVEQSLIYGRVGGVDTQFATGMAWQLRTGNALVTSGAAGITPPATGLSWFHDDATNKIVLRQTAFWNDPAQAGVGGETGGSGTP